MPSESRAGIFGAPPLPDPPRRDLRAFIPSSTSSAAAPCALGWPDASPAVPRGSNRRKVKVRSGHETGARRRQTSRQGNVAALARAQAACRAALGVAQNVTTGASRGMPSEPRAGIFGAM